MNPHLAPLIETENIRKWYEVPNQDEFYVSDEFKQRQNEYGFKDSEESNTLYKKIAMTISTLKKEHTQQMRVFYDTRRELKLFKDNQAIDLEAHKKTVDTAYRGYLDEAKKHMAIMKKAFYMNMKTTLVQNANTALKGAMVQAATARTVGDIVKLYLACIPDIPFNALQSNAFANTLDELIGTLIEGINGYTTMQKATLREYTLQMVSRQVYAVVVVNGESFQEPLASVEALPLTWVVETSYVDDYRISERQSRVENMQIDESIISTENQNRQTKPIELKREFDTYCKDPQQKIRDAIVLMMAQRDTPPAMLGNTRFVILEQIKAYHEKIQSRLLLFSELYSGFEKILTFEFVQDSLLVNIWSSLKFIVLSIRKMIHSNIFIRYIYQNDLQRDNQFTVFETEQMTLIEESLQTYKNLITTSLLSIANNNLGNLVNEFYTLNTFDKIISTLLDITKSCLLNYTATGNLAYSTLIENLHKWVFTNISLLFIKTQTNDIDILAKIIISLQFDSNKSNLFLDLMFQKNQFDALCQGVDSCFYSCIKVVSQCFREHAFSIYKGDDALNTRLAILHFIQSYLMTDMTVLKPITNALEASIVFNTQGFIEMELSDAPKYSFYMYWQQMFLNQIKSTTVASVPTMNTDALYYLKREFVPFDVDARHEYFEIAMDRRTQM